MNPIALAFLILVLSTGRVSAQGSFFEGKTIRIVVGLPADDAYDIYARMLATYLGKYIPGNPTLMVFAKTLKDPDLLAEAKKKNLEIDPTSGEDLETWQRKSCRQIKMPSTGCTSFCSKLNDLRL